MNLQLVALTLNVTGEVLLGMAVLLTHYKLRSEHKLNKKVFKEFRKEQAVGALAIAFIIASYIMNLYLL